jgi:hypothetical protein
MSNIYNAAADFCGDDFNDDVTILVVKLISRVLQPSVHNPTTKKNISTPASAPGVLPMFHAKVLFLAPDVDLHPERHCRQHAEMHSTPWTFRSSPPAQYFLPTA